MRVPKPWLEALTLIKLHRLATAVGAPCSGTKVARIEGIRHAISSVVAGGKDPKKPPNLSLLSIDMGIRNLAFAHITAPIQIDSSSIGSLRYDTPTLQAWHRVAVSSPLADVNGRTPPVVSHGADPGGPEATTRKLADGKETFEPIDYARHAYNLIKYMLQTYQPNQILIERQRFRSGGQSAVQEWTIRVGVFEGMLYSVLRTLVEERKVQLSVEPMLPLRVNRYWLEGREKLMPSTGKTLTGRHVKRAKIDLVGEILDGKRSSLAIAEDLMPFAGDFVSTWKNGGKGKPAASVHMSKLDDLADSLLQGLAWIDWQNNRRRIEAFGRDAVDIESGVML